MLDKLDLLKYILGQPCYTVHIIEQGRHESYIHQARSVAQLCCPSSSRRWKANRRTGPDAVELQTGQDRCS